MDVLLFEAPLASLRLYYVECDSNYSDVNYPAVTSHSYRYNSHQVLETA